MSDEAKAIYIAQVLKGLHDRWVPHETQVQVLNAIFHQGKKTIGVECGRKWGKTDIVQYTTWRGCSILGGADTYYIAPTSTQAEELIWANGRIKGFGPKELIASANETKLRLRFKSGSFLKLDGSEQYEKYRGVEPDLLMYDEYKDFHPKFHPAMEPNLGAKASKGMGILMVVGTPPEVDSHPQDPSRKHPFYELMDEIKEDPDGAYFNYTTYDNPHISHDWIEKQKLKYIARGDLAGFQREHMAMRVKGGPGAIFPMFDRRVHVHSHNKLMQIVERDVNNLQRWVICDPGTETVFGTLFSVTNPYTKDVYILDEIYAKSAAETSTGVIIPKIAAKRKELLGNRMWVGIYDEAAAWFANEAAYSYQESFLPTHKAWDKKGAGLNLIKDQFLEGKMHISDRCINLIWELENYVKDKNGRIPKVNDHEIDCLRYLNAAAGFNFEEEDTPDEPEDEHERRAFTAEQDRDTDRAMEPDFLMDGF